MFHTIQMSAAGSQDTGFFGSCCPSVSSLPSDIHDRLSLRSQMKAHTDVDKGPGQPQCQLPSSASQVVSITNNTFYMNPKPPFCSVQPWPLSFPSQPIEVRFTTSSTYIHDTCIQTTTSLATTYIQHQRYFMCVHIIL